MLKKIIVVFLVVIALIVGVQLTKTPKKNTVGNAMDDYVSPNGYYEATNFMGQLENLYPEEFDNMYGGGWFEGKVPYIALTYVNDEILDLARRTRVNVVEVEYSYNELLRIDEEFFNYYFTRELEVPDNYFDENCYFTTSITEKYNGIEMNSNCGGNILDKLKIIEYYYKFWDVIRFENIGPYEYAALGVSS